MVHAWGESTRDPRAAFHATGHLMKMVKLVQQQRRDGLRGEFEAGDPNDEADDDSDDNDVESSRIEPNKDDFRVVMEAWTRAE